MLSGTVNGGFINVTLYFAMLFYDCIFEDKKSLQKGVFLHTAFISPTFKNHPRSHTQTFKGYVTFASSRLKVSEDKGGFHMRTLLLTTTLLLASSPAFCTPSCAVASASAETAAPSTILALQSEGLALSSGSQAAPLEPDRISRVPALRRIASNGAQLFDLGTQHGIQAVFARNGSTFQVFYLAPDGQAAIGGVMWDAAGHNVTRDQVAPIDGTIPTVTIGTPAPAVAPTPVAASTPALSALKVAQSTTFGNVGVALAPRLYVFIDPLCAFSVRAMDQLRPYVAAGKLQLAVIPLAEIDYETHGQSTVAAKSLLSLPPEQIVTAWRNQQTTPLPPPSPEADSLLARNMAAAQAIALRGTPTMVWRKADGTEGRVEGIPDSIDALVTSMGR